MIQRYSREVMRNLFEDENRFQAWLEIELCVAEAFSEMGVIPKEDILKLRKDASFDIERIYEIEKETFHDVVAFTRSVSETLGEEKRWIHYGLTSTDVVDTAYGYIYKQANDIIYDDLLKLKEVLKKRALEFKDTPSIGRTHGIHADITSFGLKFALWYDELNRHIDRFQLARRDVEAGKISGAVGNFANTKPFIQDFVCNKLGLESTNISTQVLQRDRHAHFMSVLALIASFLEKMAIEVRHLQRTEVSEAEEFFRKGQKGSSAMPHKRNPISSENITGGARVIRGYMLSAYENIALWHERDISHSSAERIIFPDALILLDYMLNRFTNVLDNLLVYPDKMLENIGITHGVIFAQRVMNVILAKHTISRESAYDLVQPIAMQSYETKTEFKKLLMENENVLRYLNKDEIEQCFELGFFLQEVDTIYRRVGLIE
ncbi:MAG: adenylosuccinate lyase [Erysipelothrix sp.]|nr:adenylosuccinate lyase [Erysipelothrix sp.]